MEGDMKQTSRFRIHPIRQESSESVNLTPLLDVVFIMLIFFIVTASFVKEFGIDLSRSDAAVQTTRDKALILITISATDRIWIDRRPVDVGSVRANMERLLAEKPNAPVVIRADTSSSNGMLVKVIDLATQAGAVKISLSAET
jgi:biopolymer transport protein ExbD